MSGAWLTEPEQATWRAWVRAQTLLDAQISRQLQRDTDLSQADYAVLVHLSEAPEGRLRGFALAQGLQWEKSRLSHHLSRMEKRGLIVREGCPTDGRGAFVVLTDEGRNRIVDAAPKHVAEVRAAFIDPLTPAQLAALGDACRAIVEAIEGRGDVCATAGDCGSDAG